MAKRELQLGEADQLIPRPDVLTGRTYLTDTSVGSTAVTINGDDDGLREVIVRVDRADPDVAADAEAIGRLASLILRIRTDLESGSVLANIADALAGTGINSAIIGFGPSNSLPRGIGEIVRRYQEERFLPIRIDE